VLFASKDFPVVRVYGIGGNQGNDIMCAININYYDVQECKKSVSLETNCQ